MNHNTPEYVPQFECPQCGKVRTPQINGDQGLLTMCDCRESQDAWEKQHRIEMERRKRLKRGLR